MLRRWAGAATTTSPSTTTIISIATRTLTVATVRRSCHRADVATAAISAETVGTPIGSTIPSIAEVPRIGTELPQTGSAARHVGTLWRIARPVLANRLAGKAAICPATGREAVAA